MVYTVNNAIKLWTKSVFLEEIHLSTNIRANVRHAWMYESGDTEKIEIKFWK